MNYLDPVVFETERRKARNAVLLSFDLEARRLGYRTPSDGEIGFEFISGMHAGIVSITTILGKVVPMLNDSIRIVQEAKWGWAGDE